MSALSEGGRLKVWFWSGRDPVSLDDLEFVVASSSRKAIQGYSARLRLPKPDHGQYHVLKMTHEACDVALGRPGHVFWRDREISHEWRSETELDAVRRTSKAQHGTGTPLHRP